MRQKEVVLPVLRVLVDLTEVWLQLLLLNVHENDARQVNSIFEI